MILAILLHSLTGYRFILLELTVTSIYTFFFVQSSRTLYFMSCRSYYRVCYSLRSFVCYPQRRLASWGVRNQECYIFSAVVSHEFWMALTHCMWPPIKLISILVIDYKITGINTLQLSMINSGTLYSFVIKLHNSVSHITQP